MKTLANFFAVLICLLTGLTKASAGDLEWSGLYRIEGYQITNSELDDRNREKSYGLHHLILKPKIVASDGLNIYSRFDIFNNGGYPGSALGQVWGNGLGDAAGSNTDNTLSETQEPETIEVTQLYLTVVQEFGTLIAGRAPLHFGLGANFNAGNGPFDHWLETRDMVGYKIVMGNMYLFPMYAKVAENDLAKGTDDVSDMIIQFQYDNPETDLEMGVIYQDRRTGRRGNDTTAMDGGFGGNGATGQTGTFTTKLIGLYVKKDTDNFKVGVEAGFLDGEAGVDTQAGEDVKITAFGVAGEFEWRPQGSKYKFGANIGYATGDDPETDDEFEGYIFDRNYDVAFLLFNHPVGQADFLRTKSIGGHPGAANTVRINQPDTEAISNVMYISPYVDYKWSDRWSATGTLTAGFLNESPIAGANVDKSLGYEFDLSLNFRPNERVTWVNQVGLLFPGSAFEGGTEKFDSSFAYGLSTKAAISF